MSAVLVPKVTFLSIQAQDFIEETYASAACQHVLNS